MERIQEFISNHTLLVSATIVVIIAVIVNEIVRYFRGQRPISVAEAVRLINNDNAVVVDTRSKKDFDKGHVIDAIHVPMAGIESRAKEIAKAKDRTIICYCATGSNSGQAAAKLRKLGYTQVHVLKGGLSGWQDDGMPVTQK